MDIFERLSFLVISRMYFPRASVHFVILRTFNRSPFLKFIISGHSQDAYSRIARQKWSIDLGTFDRYSSLDLFEVSSRCAL